MTQGEYQAAIEALTPDEQLEFYVALSRMSRGISLADFVEATTNFTLHSWQRDHLCPTLERLRDEKGLRIAIHGPPQYGKSVIVSQRAPAWLIGHRPDVRNGLACYNETHATGFGQVIVDLIQGPEFFKAFGDNPLLHVRKDAPAGRFQTAAREAAADGQASFLAMGLLSGFTGKGVDNLFIDDPYKSAEEARSSTINDKVWRWWTQTAGPRIPDTTNVVVMFHRYHDDDLAGRMIAAGFEYIRFPAIADGNEDGSDPTGRAPGELLSPMRSRNWLEKQRDADIFVFSGQFQGTPQPETGGFFKTEKLNYCDYSDLPKDLMFCRAWDFAATAGAGDWTTGPKLGRTYDNRYFIVDMVRDRWSTDDVDANVLATARRDGQSIPIHIPEDPGAAGKKSALAFVRMLAGFSVTAERMSGSKAERARPFSSQVNIGNVTIVRAHWNTALVKELKSFIPDNDAGVDDQVDACSDAFNYLSTGCMVIPTSGGTRGSVDQAQALLQRSMPQMQQPSMPTNLGVMSRPGNPLNR